MPHAYLRTMFTSFSPGCGTSASAGYDGGDCCSCTCEDAPADFYQCGQSGFACVDPDALCNLESAASAVTTSSFVSGAALIIILGAVQAATAG